MSCAAGMCRADSGCAAHLRVNEKFGEEDFGVLDRLFRKSVSRERAITLATEFLAANGCRVVSTAADAHLAADDIPVVFDSVSKPGRRWYVEFERVMPPGVSCTHTGVSVYIWEDTGQITFDHFAGWE